MANKQHTRELLSEVIDPGFIPLAAMGAGIAGYLKGRSNIERTRKVIGMSKPQTTGDHWTPQNVSIRSQHDPVGANDKSPAGFLGRFSHWVGDIGTKIDMAGRERILKKQQTSVADIHKDLASEYGLKMTGYVEAYDELNKKINTQNAYNVIKSIAPNHAHLIHKDHIFDVLSSLQKRTEKIMNDPSIPDHLKHDKIKNKTETEIIGRHANNTRAIARADRNREPWSVKDVLARETALEGLERINPILRIKRQNAQEKLKTHDDIIRGISGILQTQVGELESRKTARSRDYEHQQAITSSTPSTSIFDTVKRTATRPTIWPWQTR